MNQLYHIYTPGYGNAIEVMLKPSEYAHILDVINDATSKQRKSVIIHVVDKGGHGWTLNGMNLAIQERFKKE
jgi:hypothetical protein